MASSEIQTEDETGVAEPAHNTDTVTIDNVFTASMYGDLEKLRKFVEQDGASLSLPDNDGHYALQWAAKNNFPEIVQYIIEHGVDVNAVDKYQQTALHCAAKRGWISVADVLLQNGAQVEAADVIGFRAVHVAALYGQTSFLNHIVEKYNADFDVPDNDGRSPLHWAAKKGFVDTVKWLVSSCANHKRCDKEGFTPLYWAARQGELEVCMVLVDVGTMQDIKVKTKKGNTPVQLASYEGREEVKLLVCKALQTSNIKGEALQKGNAKGTNWPTIIATQGGAYTGKSLLAKKLAWRLRCPIISLDDFLDASEPTDEQDTLISHTFNLIANIVKSQISLGLSVVVDSPLSRLSHLQKLVALISTENPHNTRVLIVECKPENEYAYQLRFEDSGSDIYKRKWYKPKGNWPLPKVPRDYTDDDIPHGVSKLVLDTTDYYSPCKILRIMFDVTSCSYGHITKYDYHWHFIHTEKKEQFTCPCCNMSRFMSTFDNNLHFLTFCVDINHCDKLCGVCDNQVVGPCYTCKHCPLTLHELCAELARDGNKHFVPESFPRLMSSEPHSTYAFPVERACAECEKDGNGFSCKCKHCLFESHLKSQLVPTVVRHRAHDDFLTLWLNSDFCGYTHHYMCSACRKSGTFAVYILIINNTYYHPQCLLLPPSVHHTHGGYTHDLEMIISRLEKEEDYLCNCCLYKMDPTAWYYYCSQCDISMHLECAFQDFDSGGSIVEACPLHP